MISDYEVRDVLVSMAGWTPIVRDIFANNLATIPVRTALFHCSTAKSNALIKVLIKVYKSGKNYLINFRR